MINHEPPELLMGSVFLWHQTWICLKIWAFFNDCCLATASRGRSYAVHVRVDGMLKVTNEIF